ncbi:Outer envelope pore protein 37 chloroplastic [Euphorbia peplus]|nr:Outer envelope pore protein 37 chloroplastic [Euphorbia peplus]
MGPPPPLFHGVKVTSNFDSNELFHKISCKLFDSLAKLKFTFVTDNKGIIFRPHLTFKSKLLSIHYQFDHQNALLESSFDLTPNLHLKVFHNVKAKRGEVEVLAKLSDLGYALKVSSHHYLSNGPRSASLKFPAGEVSVSQMRKYERERELYVHGVVKGRILNGLCTGQFTNKKLKLTYAFKDEEISFIPTISLPSKDVSMAIKCRFSPNNKLRYDIYPNYWRAVYKQTYGKDYKFRVGYNSDFIGWASLWVGDERRKTKTAPMKMKAQFFLHAPLDNIRYFAWQFKVKKRWDI